MEDRKLPWWRRALNIALDGIRSGFGLFSKPNKEELAHEPETVSAREEAPVEAVATVVIAEEPVRLSEAVSDPVAEATVEPISEAVFEPVAEVVSEPVVEALPELEGAQDPPEEIASEQDATPHEEIVEREAEEPAVESRVEQAESASSSQAEDAAEPERESEQTLTELEDETSPAKAFVADEELRPDAVETSAGDTETSESIEDLHSLEETETEQGLAEGSIDAEDGTESAAVFVPAASQTASAPSFSEALEAALVSPPEAMAQDEEPLEPESISKPESPAPEPEPEAEATIETIAIDETAIDEAGINEQMIDELTAEAALPEPAEEIAVAAEIPQEAMPESEIHTEQKPEIAAAEESETSPESEAAEETGGEVANEEETTGGAVDLDESTQEVPTGAAEAAAELDEPAAAPEAEIESLPEAALDEELAPAEESISEEAISSVELSEPVPAEVAEETPGQPDMVGDESQEEGPAAPDPVPQIEEPAELAAEPAAGQAAELAAEEVAEEAPEPVDIPMELNEPIPEQPTEPTEANESVPVEEAVEAAAAVVTEKTAGQTTASEMIAAEARAELADEAGPTAAATPAAPTKPFIKLESRDNESDLSPFSVVVSQVYDGPLDLLLDLIRKQDIDIYDIPIARITAQFLAYVNQLKATDVDVAGEFIYTASLLIHIKSKMLLPRAPSGGDDAAEDPRRELVERLLEHERFKNAAQMLQQKQMLEAATWTNPGIREFQDDTSAEPEIAADTVDLVRIFRDILERARNRPVIDVEEDSVTVGQMIQFLARRLTMEDKPVALRRLLSQTRSERALIAMFLALLELVRLQAILLRQDRLFSEIFIKKHVGFESVMNEGAASVHDDWR